MDEPSMSAFDLASTDWQARLDRRGIVELVQAIIEIPMTGDYRMIPIGFAGHRANGGGEEGQHDADLVVFHELLLCSQPLGLELPGDDLRSGYEVLADL